MSYKTEDGTCRICSNVAPSNVSLNMMVDGYSLVEMLRYCANIEINEYDGLPYHCCMNCKTDLLVAYKLITRCHQSDVKFRGQLVETKTDREYFPMETSLMPLLPENLIKTELTDDETMPSKEIVYADPFCNADGNVGRNPLDNNQSKASSEGTAIHEEVNSNKAMEHDTDSVQSDDDDNKEMLNSKRTSIVHTEPKRCCKCKVKLSTIEDVREHSQTVHMGSRTTDSKRSKARPFECDVCFKRYTTKKALNIHQQQLYIANEHKCDQCEEDFNNEELLGKHKELHDKESVQPHSNRKDQFPRCCACYEQFDTDELLKKHANEVHLPESVSAEDKDNQYSCNLCHRRYKNLRGLRDHQLKPYRLQHYQCATCGRIFRDRTTMMDHERFHQGDQPFVCPVCAKSFTKKDYFRKHVRAHSLADDRFKCDICGKGCKTKYTLKVHLITHTSQERTLQCSLCSATFARKICLQGHMKLHTGEKPYKCDQCDAAYAFLTDLRRHIMAHQGIKPFVCNICGRGYPRRDYLRKHMANHNNQG